MFDKEAVEDCQWALGMSETALHQHIDMWTGFPPSVDSPQYSYWCTIAEIKSKLGTNECLLKEKQNGTD